MHATLWFVCCVWGGGFPPGAPSWRPSRRLGGVLSRPCSCSTRFNSLQAAGGIGATPYSTNCDELYALIQARTDILRGYPRGTQRLRPGPRHAQSRILKRCTGLALRLSGNAHTHHSSFVASRITHHPFVVCLPSLPHARLLCSSARPAVVAGCWSGAWRVAAAAARSTRSPPAALLPHCQPRVLCVLQASGRLMATHPRRRVWRWRRSWRSTRSNSPISSTRWLNLPSYYCLLTYLILRLPDLFNQVRPLF